MNRLVALCLIVVAAALAGSCSCGKCEDNSAVTRAWIDAYNSRDFETLENLVAEDVTRHCAATPGVVVENREQAEKYASTLAGYRVWDHVPAAGDLDALAAQVESEET